MIAWGGGVHHCPGEMFSLLEVRTAVDCIVSVFKPLEFEKLGEIHYFSPSAISEREISAVFKRY